MTSRNRAWADVRIVEALGSGSSVLKDLLAGAPVVDTLTVIRLVGEIRLSASPQGENEYEQTIDIGIGVSSSQAFATAGALPDLKTLGFPPRGWLYKATDVCYQSLPTGGTPTAMWRKDCLFKFDLRAMRKIDKGTLYMELENTARVGTATTLNITGFIRALCLT